MFKVGRRILAQDIYDSYSIGPLVSIDASKSTSTEKVATLIGIISWSAGCADLEYPDVYARVADVLPWITEKTGINIF